jgi:DnaJ-class molecular chaperone with C-terminal Zn finger domain
MGLRIKWHNTAHIDRRGCDENSSSIIYLLFPSAHHPSHLYLLCPSPIQSLTTLTTGEVTVFIKDLCHSEHVLKGKWRGGEGGGRRRRRRRGRRRRGKTIQYSTPSSLSLILKLTGYV